MQYRQFPNDTGHRQVIRTKASDEVSSEESFQIVRNLKFDFKACVPVLKNTQNCLPSAESTGSEYSVVGDLAKLPLETSSVPPATSAIRQTEHPVHHPIMVQPSTEKHSRRNNKRNPSNVDPSQIIIQRLLSKMADFHPLPACPPEAAFSPRWFQYMQQAEQRAKLMEPAQLPSMDHLTYLDFEHGRQR